MTGRIDRAELISKLKSLAELTDEERSSLIGLLRQHKKYGLVWEDKPEEAERLLEDQLPVFKEVKERALLNGADAPNHILIEGDNLHALTALSYTHAGKVDVIYIDPPYNTGNKDFVYNDSFVDTEDAYRHSKWLSFMSKRLKIAKKLLSDKGVIFISIDDNEQANLKLLCDEVLGANNFISDSFVLDNLKGKANDNFITSVGSRLLVYGKSKANLTEIGFSEVENIYGDLIESKYKDEDEYGYFNLITFKKTGQAKLREERPFMFYPILEKEGVLYAITQSEYDYLYNKDSKSFNDEFLFLLRNKYSDFNFILPVDNKGVYLRWTSGFNTFLKKMNSDIVYYNGNIMQKSRPSANEMTQIFASGTPKNFMYKPTYSMGTDDLKNVLENISFSFPKPLQLLIDIQKLLHNSDYTILDFFAGSGTTLHATMQLNAEDGGHRQCILVTNNERRICEEVTYERNKRVIEGYTTPKCVQVEGLKHNNLRYYKTEFISRERTVKNMRALVSAATDLLCIKENVYQEQEGFGGLPYNNKVYRYFEENSHRMLIIYQEEFIPAIVSSIEASTTKGGKEGILKVYVFSPDRDPYADEFWKVEDRVALCALPAAIYDAYMQVLPRRKDKAIAVNEEQVVTDADEWEA